MSHNIQYAKWPKLVKMKEEYDNAIKEGRSEKEIESKKNLFEGEVQRVIISFYEEYSSMLLRFSHDKIIRAWHAPRKKKDLLDTAETIIIEVERLREVIKFTKKCNRCNRNYIFECPCI